MQTYLGAPDAASHTQEVDPLLVPPSVQSCDANELAVLAELTHGAVQLNALGSADADVPPDQFAFALPPSLTEARAKVLPLEIYAYGIKFELLSFGKLVIYDTTPERIPA